MENEFDKLTELLRLNIYSSNPHLSILPFLSENFPYLVIRPESVGWTSYPPELVNIPKMTRRSLQLPLHPFIETEHSGAKIDFLTQEWANSPAGISQIRIWIYFSTRVLAEATQRHLVKKFLNIGATNIWLNNNTENKATVYKDSDMDDLSSVSFLLKENTENLNSLLILFSDDKGDIWSLDSA